MNVWPGDLVAAAVLVNGHRVTVTVVDRTRGEVFARVVYAPSVDVSSADWIVEAPSNCVGSSSCSQLPLANFGTVPFSHARAVTTTGRAGRIANGRWQATRLMLSSGGRQFVSAGSAAVQASASSLRASGAAFTVTHTARVVATTRRLGTRLAGHLLHPGP